MTIQTIFYNGEKRVTNIYRKVYANKNLDRYIQGFFAQREQYKWGVLVQLKGKEKIMMRSFGKLASGMTVTHLEMIERGDN